MNISSKLFSLPLIMLLCSFSSMAQLQEIESTRAGWVTVGEIKWLANTKASLKYFVSRNDTTYMLRLQDEQKLKNNRDMTVSNYFSIEFDGMDNTAGKLYDMLTSFFSDENKKNKSYEKVFRLGTEAVIVRHFPKLTTRSIVLATAKNSIVLTQNEVKKLFGRK